ncbi:MAG TPA: hypothetical protein VGL82_07825 [Bryobacteraceae bacterium]
MNDHTRFKRWYTVLTICWIGACFIAPLALVSAGGSLRGPSQARVVAREWVGYSRDFFKDISGPEYVAIRQSAFFQDLASLMMQAGHNLASTADGMIADAGIEESPQESGMMARLMTVNKTEVLAWLGVTALPPILVYLLAFVALPKIAGPRSEEQLGN